jgi:RNA polymerase sigma-70 factor (ECF subfamily)
MRSRADLSPDRLPQKDMNGSLRNAVLACEREPVTKEQRFEDLVERQARFVFRVAYAILRNIGDSEDVVQETFLKLHRSGAWDRMADERAFLATTAWRIAVDYRALRTRDTPSSATITRETPEQFAIAADRTAVVHRLIDALPEELRQPLALSTVEEMTSGEIAKILGIPEGTVRTRLMRAREVLKQKLGIYEHR